MPSTSPHPAHTVFLQKNVINLLMLHWKRSSHPLDQGKSISRLHNPTLMDSFTLSHSTHIIGIQRFPLRNRKASATSHPTPKLHFPARSRSAIYPVVPHHTPNARRDPAKNRAARKAKLFSGESHTRPYRHHHLFTASYAFQQGAAESRPARRY